MNAYDRCFLINFCLTWTEFTSKWQANHRSIADTPKVAGPRERKKRRMRYANNGLLLAYKKLKRSFISITNNGCPGETTR